MQKNTTVNNSTNTCPFYYIEFIGYFYIQTSICFIGFWLNLTCFIVFRNRNFRKAVHYYMSALAIFDAITLLIIFPEGLMRCSNTTITFVEFCRNDWFLLIRKWIYIFTIYVAFGCSNITEFVSIIIVLIITWERFQAMRGLCHANRETSSYTFNIIILIFLISCIVNLPFFFVQAEQEKITRITHTKGNISWTSNVAQRIITYTSFGNSNCYYIYVWIRMFIIPLFTLMLITALSVMLIYVTHRSFKHYSKRNYDNNQEISMISQTQTTTLIRPTTLVSLIDRRQRIEFTLTFVLILLILLFIIGQFPQAFSFRFLYAKITNNCPKDNINIVCCYDYKLYRLISYILSLLTYSTPFFIYIRFDRTFRKVFSEIFLGHSNCHDENLELNLSEETFNITTNIKKQSNNSGSNKENITTCCSKEVKEDEI